MRKPLALAALLLVPPLGAQAPVPLRLGFADAVRRAADQAPAVTLAGLRTDEAGARVRETRASLLPDFSLTGGWLNRTFNSHSLGISFPGFPALIGPFNNYDARAHASLTLFDFASYQRVDAAHAQVTAAASEGSAVTEAAAQAAAAAYLRAVRARSAVAARQADSSIAAELLGLAQAQLKAGVSATIDVTRARTQFVSAEGGLIVARNQFDRAKIDLLRALGLDPATPVELADTLSGALGAADVPGDRDAAVAQALAGRPDLQAEIARGRAAAVARGAISAERLPRLDVAADFGVNGLTPPSAIGTGQVGLQVTVPILDGFRREGRLAEQDAVVRESRVREQDLRLQIAADVDGARLDLASAVAQEAIAAERLQLAQDELAQARERFKAGVAGNIEVIDAQSSLVRARDADIDARFAAAGARVALARAVGVARTLH
ncbi:MAG TPA: TolC family protein [Gemmatimonadales bacterium]